MKSIEIAHSIRTGSFDTNYHDLGEGFPIVLIHGSGPGVTAWANWRLLMPKLAEHARVIAPDMSGFGFTERIPGQVHSIDAWVRQLADLLDALDVEQVDLVGNSFGGGISLAFAIRYPARVRKLVLMGSAGAPFTLTPGLDAVWGYTPSSENMRGILDIFAYDRTLVTDELAELRYRASIQPGFQESFASMFPAPRQRWVDSMANTEESLRQLKMPALIIHGREDRVVPLEASLTLFNWLEHAQLHVFGECGHWAQIEHAERFAKLVKDFISE
ncbi:2-hydroxy-6-oxo-2,4-heptadienoate hydrolase [Burkholderia sp. MSh2]|uniref:2-hydroxy-6-oxo-2,4-heptadienoate hydrolase n=1 Tax=Burkholderia paludis TaxID=1506587 RepID=A0A6J5DEF1_9BURK|nr:MULTISPECIES: alpha/beta fold hydrolase [Burkholderia]KEZ03455.1 2-hydroxy-6-oxo-2,4-heptadienoate hydrolase [Burkholderia sp. MSh2]KFG95345.1 2-hydroxy-6-oxo-2,4-heptadienoate hydrolase [Burkholderia paludis]CAB3752313.1 2-hydroxy-6-oxo-2,4-heptadienoate hydrolase [Burkholderia paludis]VWB47508.1 2-hydroxy-6-oxo-2,4-heptadienoate hydrolase [Burkholderia paludis]